MGPLGSFRKERVGAEIKKDDVRPEDCVECAGLGLDTPGLIPHVPETCRDSFQICGATELSQDYKNAWTVITVELKTAGLMLDELQGAASESERLKVRERLERMLGRCIEHLRGLPDYFEHIMNLERTHPQLPQYCTDCVRRIFGSAESLQHIERIDRIREELQALHPGEINLARVVALIGDALREIDGLDHSKVIGLGPLDHPAELEDLLNRLAGNS